MLITGMVLAGFAPLWGIGPFGVQQQILFGPLALFPAALKTAQGSEFITCLDPVLPSWLWWGEGIVEPTNSEFMGCLPSKTANGSKGDLKHRGEKYKKVKWKAEKPLSVSKLQAMREEFWDTQPHYGGDKGNWREALFVAVIRLVCTRSCCGGN